MNYTFDACALIAFFRREAGGEVVRDILMDIQSKVAMHAINMYEVYYDLDRSEGVQAANRSLDVAMEVGIEIREDMDPALWKTRDNLNQHQKNLNRRHVRCCSYQTTQCNISHLRSRRIRQDRRAKGLQDSLHPVIFLPHRSPDSFIQIILAHFEREHKLCLLELCLFERFLCREHI